MKWTKVMMVLMAMMVLCVVTVTTAQDAGTDPVTVTPPVTVDDGFNWTSAAAIVATIILGFLAMQLPKITMAIQELSQAFKVLGTALEDNKISNEEAKAIKKEFTDVWKAFASKDKDPAPGEAT